MMFFLTLSVCCPLRFLNKASPLSWLNPKFDFGSIFRTSRTSRTLHPAKARKETSKTKLTPR